MSGRIGVAIVGVGGIVVGQHLKHLAALPNVQIVGYLRNKSGRAAKAAEEFGGRLYDTIDQIADDPAVHAVYVSVPPFAHGETELKLLQAGKALMVEKPLGLDLTTAEQIGREAAAAGVVTAVGYHWRYQSTVDHVRECLAGRAIIGGFGAWCGGRPDVWWWRDKATSGGQAVEQTTHVYDMANYLIDSPPVSVYATGRQIGVYTEPQHTVDDVSVAQVRYANGVAVSVWSSDVMTGPAARIGLELFAVNGRYDVGFNHLACHDETGTKELKNEGNPYQRLTVAFIKAVATGDRSDIRSTYDQALVTHRVTMAVERSIASGDVETI